MTIELNKRDVTWHEQNLTEVIVVKVSILAIIMPLYLHKNKYKVF